MTTFHLPDLGEGLPDAEIRQWHVKIGDVVKVDDLLVSMETAKAVVDVPAPYSGKIVKLHGNVGDIIKTEAPLVEFETADSDKSTTHKDAGTVVGAMEVGDTVLRESATGITPTRSSEPTIKAIPAVRALAKKLNVDLSNVTPTGPNGAITAEDVEKAVGQSSSNVAAAIPGMVEAIRGVRRAMASAMSQSHAEVVPVTLVDDADIHAWPENTDITARVLRAVVAGCSTEPALNAHFDSKKMERHLFKHVNIGIAMDSKEGLFVPVLKHAETMTAGDMRKTIERSKEEVRNRTIPQDDLKGSTIQLSNFGTFAGRYANPIIVPPTVAILGIGRLRMEPVVFNNSVVIHRMMPLSLSIDHRAISGGEAARFLAAVIEDLQKSQ